MRRSLLWILLLAGAAALVGLAVLERAEVPPNQTSQPFVPAGSDKLAVIVQSVHGRTSIQHIERTNGQSTAELYQPAPGQTTHTLEVFGPAGQVLKEVPFTLTGSVLVDDAAVSSGVEPVGASTVYLAMDVPDTPSSVQVRAASGGILDSQSFRYSRLPHIQAATQPERVAAAGIFTIAVINELGSQDSLSWIEHQTNSMLLIEPWRTFRRSVKVVPVENTEAFLGCTITQSGAPQCPDGGRVIGAVSQHVPDWNAIVVAVNADCNCGSVAEGFPPIVAISSRGTSGIIAHQLGHAVGKLLDEDAYRTGGLDGGPEPNCYPDKQQCEAATSIHPDAKCSPGCVRDDLWRPANRIMHNLYQPLEFGPIERCVMGNAIAAVIGSQYECTPRSGDGFPGWIR